MKLAVPLAVFVLAAQAVRGATASVEVPMDKKQQVALLQQMHKSLESDPAARNLQNHGTVTGNEKAESSVEDLQLQRAVAILSEDAVFENLLTKYHKPPSETQVAAGKDEKTEEPTALPEDDKQLPPEVTPTAP